MANSYMLVILNEGRVASAERRKFADLPQRALGGHQLYADGSLDDHAALLLTNLWTSKSVRQAEASDLPVHFVYYL